MVSFRLIVLILAFILFAAAACGVQSRVNLTAAGLALWVLSVIVG